MELDDYNEIFEPILASIETDYVKEEQHLRNRSIREDIYGKEQERKMRKNYARRIFIFLSTYAGLVLAIIVLNGFKLLSLSDTVLCVLLGTSLADVIGLMAIVARYLFPVRH